MDMEQKHSQMSLLFLLRKQLGRILTEETDPAKLADSQNVQSLSNCSLYSCNSTAMDAVPLADT